MQFVLLQQYHLEQFRLDDSYDKLYIVGKFQVAHFSALIRSVMTYACPAWEFAAESHLLKLQRLQNRVLRTIRNFPRRTSVRDLHLAFQIP
jgi:hypothetical protein